MSSKKATSAKKPAAKSAPKAAAKKPAAKPAPKAAAKKPAAKPAPKAATKVAKQPAKGNAKAKVDTKKVAPKAAAKPADNKSKNAKAVVKELPKSKAKSAPKQEQKVKEVKAKPEPKKPAAKPETKVEESKAKSAKKPEPEQPKVEESVKPAKASAKPEVEVIEEDVKPEPAPASNKKVVAYAVLLEGGKKLSKTIMFTEVPEDADRTNQKKVSSSDAKLERKPTMAIRHKLSLAEETQEELTERILKELEEQNAAFTREAATQMCTRCNRNLVSPEFWVDKHLGYCEECAAILHLGQSKEARKVEYQLGAMGGDSLDEVEDDDIEGPDAADLKEAEEELADFDD